MIDKNFSFNFCFTTGRSGTAALAQAMAHRKWLTENKGTIHFDDHRKTLVSHEEGFDAYPVIEQLKKLDSLHSDEAKEIQIKFLTKIYKKLHGKYPIAEKFFTSHMFLGRFFAPCFNDIGLHNKVILLKRRKEDVVNSFSHLLGNPKLDNIVWTRMFYSPLDKFAINKVSEKVFNALPKKEKLEWFYDEYMAQWELCKQNLNSKTYLEVEFERMVGKYISVTLKEISNFLGMVCSETFMYQVNSLKDRKRK